MEDEVVQGEVQPGGRRFDARGRGHIIGFSVVTICYNKIMD